MASFSVKRWPILAFDGRVFLEQFPVQVAGADERVTGCEDAEPAGQPRHAGGVRRVRRDSVLADD